MESQQLRIFLEVARARSITRAAEHMGYVQTNVSAHIKKLEEELQTPLFVRSRKGVILNEYGERLLYRAERIIRELDELPQEFCGKRETLVIAATQTIAGFLLPQCLKELHRHAPDIVVSVRVLDQDMLEAQFEQGKLDCLITNNPDDMRFGRLLFQQEEHLRLAAPASCMSLDAVWDYPMLVNTIKSCPYRKALLSWRSQQQKGNMQIMEYDSLDGLLNMVAMGGISVLPQHVLKSQRRFASFAVDELPSSLIRMWVQERAVSAPCELIKSVLHKELDTEKE